MQPADTNGMERHLSLVHSVTEVSDSEVATIEREDTNVVDLDIERARRRHHRYHPSAGRAWLDTLFDDDDLDPVC